MSEEQVFVILGAALAGASAARTLREEGFEGRIRLLGAEAHHPYIRPPLSKEYLLGKADRGTVFVEDDEWYTDNNVEFSPGTTAVGLDLAAHTATLESGEAVAYDKLLLATGSTPRRLTIPGADLAGVHYLRTIDDSERLRAILSGGGKSLVVIGSGWIGMEVAATARTLGNEVTILERDPVPLAAALGDELGQFFADRHAAKGVAIRPSTIVDRVIGDDGRVSGVALGEEIVPADFVLVGIGAVPNLALAEAAGIDIEGGVLTDASMKTSDPDVFAAGDIAAAWHPVAHLRLRSEHWANALKGGQVAARAMLGQPAEHDSIPYFYTDQFDIGMEYSGYGPLTRGASVVYRGSREKREFIAFWIADGRVVAGMNVNVWDVNEAVQGIIARGNQVDPAMLADTSVPLDSL